MTARIIVIGSASQDMVLRMQRRPRKGETVQGISFDLYPGGKGNNQAIAAAKAAGVAERRAGERDGGESTCRSVSFCGRVGKDSYGESIKAELDRHGIDTSCLRIDEESGTGLAHIYVDKDGDNSIVIVPRANAKVDSSDSERVLITDGAYKKTYLLLQLEIPMKTIVDAALLARSLGYVVLLNTAPCPENGHIPDALLEVVDYLIANQTEASSLVGSNVEDADSAFEAAEILRQGGAANVIVTLGAAGIAAIDESGEKVRVASPKVEVVDTTAAGDAFCGALAAALASGNSLSSACEFACAAGALATTVPGAVPSLPDRVQILELQSESVTTSL